MTAHSTTSAWARSRSSTSLQEPGLRLRHYAVPRFLATTEGALQRELSTRLGYGPSAIVALTDEGRVFLRDSDEAGLRVTGELLEPLDPGGHETPHALLLRITKTDPR